MKPSVPSFGGALLALFIGAVVLINPENAAAGEVSVKKKEDIPRMQHTVDRTALAGSLAWRNVTLQEKKELLAEYRATYGKVEASLYVAIRPAEHLSDIMENACHNGDFDSCVALGNIYLRGELVAKDERRAASLYSQGCQGDSPEGCHNLGTLYELGIGVSVDSLKILKYSAKGCRLGNQESCQRVIELSARTFPANNTEPSLSGDK